MSAKPVLGILLGDAAGVGPEIVAKIVASGFLEEQCKPILIGDLRVFERAMAIIGDMPKLQVVENVDEATWENGIPFMDRKNVDPKEVPYGNQTEISGSSCLDMLDLGIDLFKRNKIEGFAFAPLNKAAMKDAGCSFESEHHYLAHLLGHTEPFGEINVCENVWTTRTTSHIPIKNVSESLNENSIGRAIRLSNYTLKNSGIEKPRIAVAALNPHAGENGTCGREEIDIITPVIEKYKKEGYDVKGPYPSDILFIKAFNGEFDGVVTMYHDQGQIALKLRGFDQGITIAGGLEPPIVTCGHGTAYDIAGKGIVKSSAFENAVKMTAKMAKHRQTLQ
ncbi:MAG: PdxA family protein [Suipraeoptans sp.]